MGVDVGESLFAHSSLPSWKNKYFRFIPLLGGGNPRGNHVFNSLYVETMKTFRNYLYWKQFIFGTVVLRNVKTDKKKNEPLEMLSTTNSLLIGFLRPLN